MVTIPLSLDYIMRSAKPENKNAPVLFMLHGYGSNEEDLFSYASELPEELCIISIKAPYNLEPNGHAWYAINFDAEQGKWSDDQQAIASREKIVQFIDEACILYSLDTENVTLLGFSQGTILSYAVALSYPDKVTNVIALSGYINEKILLKSYKNKDHSKLNFYCSHGQADPVIPIEWAQKAPELLENIGVSYEYEEFPVGHGVITENFCSFKQWLSNKI